MTAATRSCCAETVQGWVTLWSRQDIIICYGCLDYLDSKQRQTARLRGVGSGRSGPPCGVLQRSPSAALTAARGPGPASASTWTTRPLSIVNRTSAST